MSWQGKPNIWMTPPPPSQSATADRCIYYVKKNPKNINHLFIFRVTDWWESWGHPAALEMVITESAVKSLLLEATVKKKKNLIVIQNTLDKITRYYNGENTWTQLTQITVFHPAQKVSTLEIITSTKGVSTSLRDTEVRVAWHVFIRPF